MLVLLQNIPYGLKIFELEKFIEVKLNQRAMDYEKFHIPACDIEILDLTDGERILPVQVALIKVYPELLGKHFVKKMDGLVLKGHAIKARPFVHRDPNNDRRRKQGEEATSVFINLRKGERRKIRFVDSRHWH